MIAPSYAVLGQVAEQLTRDGARDDARRELLKREYHVGEPSLLDRVTGWIIEKVAELVVEAINVVPGGGVGLLILIAIVVALIVALRLGVHPGRLRDAVTDRRRGARSMTADDYRAEADRLAASGQWKDAVRARFRAIVRELEQRGVLDVRPGRTAGEIAREAAAAVPAISAPTRSAALVFDAIWYGDRPATAGDHDALRSADDAVRGARLAVLARS